MLVAEDNPTNQRVTQMILESGGHVATIVSNGEDALDALERANFDIALFDLSMPVVSGLEALKLYRFTAAKPIPVIILSANVTTEAIGECQRAGAAEFVAKPVRASLLLDAIERNLADDAEQLMTAPPSRSEERPSLTVVETPPLDPVVMAELANFSSDPTFVERLIRGFRSDCERLVAQLLDGLASESTRRSRMPRTRFGAGAGSVGATQLMQFATRVDKATHDTMRLKASAWSEELGQVAERTFAALDAHLELERHKHAILVLVSRLRRGPVGGGPTCIAPCNPSNELSATNGIADGSVVAADGSQARNGRHSSRPVEHRNRPFPVRSAAGRGLGGPSSSGRVLRA